MRSNVVTSPAAFIEWGICLQLKDLLGDFTQPSTWWTPSFQTGCRTGKKLLALGINEEWGITVLWLLEQGNPQWLSPKSTPGMAMCLCFFLLILDLFEWWLMAVWYICPCSCFLSVSEWGLWITCFNLLFSQ